MVSGLLKVKVHGLERLRMFYIADMMNLNQINMHVKHNIDNNA